jgi:hypothetical protein
VIFEISWREKALLETLLDLNASLIKRLTVEVTHRVYSLLARLEFDPCFTITKARVVVDLKFVRDNFSVLLEKVKKFLFRHVAVEVHYNQLPFFISKVRTLVGRRLI